LYGEVKGDFSTTLRFAQNDEVDALIKAIHFSPFVAGRYNETIHTEQIVYELSYKSGIK
jgi:hypothetical protein